MLLICLANYIHDALSSTKLGEIGTLRNAALAKIISVCTKVVCHNAFCRIILAFSNLRSAIMPRIIGSLVRIRTPRRSFPELIAKLLLFAPLPWVEIGSSPSPGLATLISHQNRCALRRRVVPTGRVHWFTSWATGLLLRRVYERTRMNKTRVVRLAGIDSGPWRGSSRGGGIGRPAAETRSYNSAREIPRLNSCVFPTPFLSRP